MKRLILLGLCLVLFAGSAFSLDWAIGGGGMFNLSWSNGESNHDVWTNTDKLTISRQGFGGFAFLGLGRYIELNFGFMYKNPSKLTIADELLGNIEQDMSGFDPVIALQFGAYFKYPIVMSERIVLFPTLGIDYEMNVNDSENLWWDDLWFRAGVGMDVFFSDRLFLRTHLIYGYGIMIGTDDSIFGSLNQAINYYAGYYWYDPFTANSYSHGLLVKVGIGFMF